MSLKLTTPGLVSKYRLAFLCLLCSMSLASCLNEAICEDVATVPVRIGFYAVDTLQDTPAPLSLSNITVFGLGRDSIIYDNVLNVSQMELPLNSTIDSCAFIFRVSLVDETKFFADDTLWFIYNRLPSLISMECGFTTFYELDHIRFTGNLFYSIAIDDANITNSLNEHIKIFPWLAEDDDEADNGTENTGLIQP